VNSGMPVLMPWADQVAAVIQAWLPGQAVGEALADVLLGDAEPGGRLPVTVPAAASDCPVLHAIPADGRLEYAEDLLIGHRGYDAAGIEPHFPFGHGLGYTAWQYTSLRLPAGGRAPGQDLRVRVTVRNAGPRAGREVVQAYLTGPPRDPAGPARWLGGFAGVTAEPDEVAGAELTIPARAFQHWDAGRSRWTDADGPFCLLVGRSSRDIRLSAIIPPPGYVR
jgi:beta-glucosidase